MIGFLKRWLLPARELPQHLETGLLGEAAAEKYLRRQGFRFIARNFRSVRGEIDLIFQFDDCLVFVEVKTRSSEYWSRPASAVRSKKQRRITRCCFDYLRSIRSPAVKLRFDICEVLVNGDQVTEIRHLPNCFSLSPPYRYG